MLNEASTIKYALCITTWRLNDSLQSRSNKGVSRLFHFQKIRLIIASGWICFNYIRICSWLYLNKLPANNTSQTMKQEVRSAELCSILEIVATDRFRRPAGSITKKLRRFQNFELSRSRVFKNPENSDGFQCSLLLTSRYFLSLLLFHHPNKRQWPSSYVASDTNRADSRSFDFSNVDWIRS